MKKYIYLILSFIIFALILSAADKKTETFKVKEIISVYDGDTFRAKLDCDIDFFCDNMSIRVYGIDTPEKRGGSGTETEKRKAKIAQKYSYEFLKDSSITLKDCFKGKYFRLVCKVIDEKNNNLSDYLINTGYAVPYFGLTKTKNWSDENDGL